jgi:predicted transcriptional regulator
VQTFRIEKTRDYTVMANIHLRDRRLSLKAKGLLSLCLSLPDQWECSIEGFAAMMKDGKASVRSAVQELEAAGYITRTSQERTEDGRYGLTEYIVREEPDDMPEDALTACENRTRTACDFPTTENLTQLNTNQVSTENTPLPPKTGGRRVSKSVPEWEPEMFARFWALYPRGEDKRRAAKEWDKLRPDRKLMETMSAALKRQMASEEWRRGVGVPYACRWLSNRRWEDEKICGTPSGEEDRRIW